MISIRRSRERGHADHGWLQSLHTFSFADYFDPKHMGFRSLRVINEDRIAGGSGFPTHPHRDMEIISYVVEGELEHQDTLGNSTRIRPGEVQRMSAGTGVRHSELNARSDRATHFFQIWIMPDRPGHEPGYGQKSFEEALAEKSLVLTVSRDGREGSIAIHQDADLYVARPKPNVPVHFEPKPGRHVWIQVVRGDVRVNDEALLAGDGLAASGESRLVIESSAESEILLFDLS